ncbi:MAG: POTRA domain-containing protein [Pseudomonadota bacterium]
MKNKWGIVVSAEKLSCLELWSRARLCPTTMLLTVLTLLLSTAAQANTNNDEAAAEKSPSFLVSNIVIEGENPLSDSDTRQILSAYSDRQMTIETLREAATEVEKALALDGYNFYRANLPPQQLQDNVVRLQIQRIDIADVRVTGNQFFSGDNIQRSLPLVSAGRSPNTRKIASALILAEDNPAKDIRVVFVKGEQPQTVDANITVSDKNPNEMYFWANNAGSALTTRSRIGGQYHHRNLWGRDHQVALSYTISPEDSDELSQYGINYRVPVYGWRGMANVFYSRSDADTGRVADVFDISGAGETYGVGYTQYLNKTEDYQHRLGVDLIDKLFDSDILFDATNIGSDVRSRPLIIEYTGRLDRNNWLLTGVVSHATNLSGGSFNNDESYALSRAGADSDWSKQGLSLRLDYRWSRDWRSQVLLFAQSTSDLLISGEKFGMGGSLGDFGPRGFFEREVVVDEGYKASFELNRNFSTRRMQLGVFFDYATGDQNNPQAGESPEETLSSIGVSYKWGIRPDLSLDLDYGYVLDGVDQRFSDGTDDGDSRLHVSLRYFPRWPWGGSK